MYYNLPDNQPQRLGFIFILTGKENTSKALHLSPSINSSPTKFTVTMAPEARRGVGTPEPDKVVARKVALLSHSFLGYVIQLKDGSTMLESLIIGKEIGKTVLTYVIDHIKSSIVPISLSAKNSLND